MGSAAEGATSAVVGGARVCESTYTRADLRVPVVELYKHKLYCNKGSVAIHYLYASRSTMTKFCEQVQSFLP